MCQTGALKSQVFIIRVQNTSKYSLGNSDKILLDVSSFENKHSGPKNKRS
jgi:hypothetical protein